MKPSDYIKKGWIQGAFARDEIGEMVPPSSAEAVCWCAVGAMRAAYPGVENDPKYQQFRERLLELLPGFQSVSGWNDSMDSPEPVIALMEQVEQELGIG